MNNVNGAEIEALRAFAHQMDQRAAEMRTRINRITSRLEHVHWVGPDRERFVHEWTSSHLPSLTGMLHELTDTATKARQHADAQARASHA